MAKQKQQLKVQGKSIRIEMFDGQEYICITDIAKSGRSNPTDILKNYLRNRSNIEFLGLWEELNNSNFNLVNFHQIKTDTGLNDFIMSMKQWITKVNAIGLYSSAGRYGGTFAHKDIAFQFATWMSATFYLYLIQEFQQLKEQEAKRQNIEWNIRRELAKVHYPLLKEAVLNRLPAQENKAGFYLADEADLINKIVFGMTAKQWRAQNPNTAKLNMRDFASVEQLLLVSDLEVVDSLLIEWDCDKKMRIELLEKFAFDLQRHFRGSDAVQRIKEIQNRALK